MGVRTMGKGCGEWNPTVGFRCGYIPSTNHYNKEPIYLCEKCSQNTGGTHGN